MTPQPLEKIPCLFLSKENHASTGSNYLAVIRCENMVELARSFLAASFHLEDISGLIVEEGAVTVYHFDNFDFPCRVSVLCIAPHDAAVFPSIAAIYDGAEWHERETRDFFGFTYTGNPNFIPLLLPEDMPNVHPLVKPEGARATLATIFSAPERKRKILRKADEFTLLDTPMPEETAEKTPEKAPAPHPAAAEERPQASKTTNAEDLSANGKTKQASQTTRAPEKVAAYSGDKGANDA